MPYGKIYNELMYSLNGKLTSNQITKNDLFNLRFLTFVGFFANLMWGLLAGFLSPNWPVSVYHHVVTLICLACTLIAFFIPLNFFGMELIKFVTGIALTTQSIFTVSAHNNAFEDIISSSICIMIVASVFENKKWSLSYSTIAVIETVIYFMITQDNKFTPAVTFMWIILIGVGSTICISRISKQEKINFNVNFISSLIGQMTEGVIVHDAQGEIVKINSAAEKILSTKIKNSIGKSNSDPMWKTFYEDDRPMPPEDHPNSVCIRENKTVLAFPVKFISSETGEVKFLEVNAVPVYASSSVEVPLYALVTITDKTKIKENEQEILNQQKILSQKNKLTALGEMAAGIAHEINNPLTISMNRLTLLKKRLSEAEKIDRNQAIAEINLTEGSLERIGRIVKNMRSLVRNSTQDPHVVTSLNELLKNILELSLSGIQKNEIQVNFVEDNQVYLKCNPIEIEQVILNLIQNSVDAIKEQKQKWINLKVFENDESVGFSITDSGSGIQNEVLEKMSQPFFTTKQNGHGTGLGLSISRAIIQRHNGQLNYNSNSKNTEFVLSFKKAVDDHQKIQPNRPHHEDRPV